MYFQPLEQSGAADAAACGKLVRDELPFAPAAAEVVKVPGRFLFPGPEPDAPRFGGGDPLSLTLADDLALPLCDIGKQSEDNISDEPAGKVFTLPGVKNGHIEDQDVSAGFSGKFPPPLDDFFVVTSQTV